MEHIAHDETSFVRPAEVGEMELYHAKTWLGKYVFSQDAKTIAIQYAATAIAIGMVALVLSWFMRLQLAWPNTFTFIDPAYYLQAVTMHGMIMVVYLLTALFLGGFGNYLIPLMVGARDMVFPWLNMISFWVYFTAVLLLAASFFVGGGSTGAGWTLYPPQAILPGTPGSEAGILLMLASLAVFIIGFHHGWSELRGDHPAGPNPRDDTDAHATHGMGHFCCDCPCAVRLPGALCERDYDVTGCVAGHQLLYAGDHDHG